MLVLEKYATLQILLTSTLFEAVSVSGVDDVITLAIKDKIYGKLQF